AQSGGGTAASAKQALRTHAAHVVRQVGITDLISVAGAAKILDLGIEQRLHHSVSAISKSHRSTKSRRIGRRESSCILICGAVKVPVAWRKSHNVRVPYLVVIEEGVDKVLLFHVGAQLDDPGPFAAPPEVCACTSGAAAGDSCVRPFVFGNVIEVSKEV